LKSIYGEGPLPFQLVTANALWGQQGYRFHPAFQEVVADYYDGALHVVNFVERPGETASAINAWVSRKTRDKIRELIRRDILAADTRLVLTNAIYFQGRWDREFEGNDTRDEDWRGPGGTRRVPMMHQTGGFLYFENDSFQALDIPYKGRQLSMLAVLPRKKNGLASLEGQWAGGGAYRKVTAELDHEGTAIVSLPRLKLETAFTLRPVLCGLHAELAFSDEADFTGISEERLKIADVVHKAFVEVNEEGTEAAAATGVRMALCGGVGGPAPLPKVFKADHPFLFFIWDRKTNAVLFSGRVLDPD
jgi:serpin B